MAHQAISQAAGILRHAGAATCPVPFQPAVACGRPSSTTPCAATKGDVSASSSTSNPPQVDRRTAMILSSSLVTSYFQLQRAAVARAQDSGASSSLAEPSASPATSNRGLARYIRKKRLDPLETYVPVVLSARSQLVSAGEVMATDAAAARALLRQGAFAGVRDNIRALGEYAGQAGQTAAVAQLVPGFFTALNEYDQVLLAATKADAKLDMDSAVTKYAAAVKTLDDLLATVPTDILNKSQAILTQANAKSSVPTADATAAAEDERLLRSLLAPQ